MLDSSQNIATNVINSSHICLTKTACRDMSLKSCLKKQFTKIDIQIVVLKVFCEVPEKILNSQMLFYPFE
jgi:hypothetical protein